MKIYPNYYWNREYRHYLRDASPREKIDVYKTFLEMDLKPDGKSDLHMEIIDIVLGFYTVMDQTKK